MEITSLTPFIHSHRGILLDVFLNVNNFSYVYVCLSKKNACMHLQTHVGLRVYVTYMSVRVHVCVEVSVEERWKGDRCIQWQSHEEWSHLAFPLSLKVKETHLHIHGCARVCMCVCFLRVSVCMSVRIWARPWTSVCLGSMAFNCFFLSCGRKCQHLLIGWRDGRREHGGG